MMAHRLLGRAGWQGGLGWFRGTQRLARQTAATTIQPRLRPCCHKQPLGRGVTRNQGARAPAGELGGPICWPGGWGGTQTIYWPWWQVGGGVEDEKLCAPLPFPTLFSVPGNQVAQPLLSLASRQLWPLGGKSRRQEAKQETVGAHGSRSAHHGNPVGHHVPTEAPAPTYEQPLSAAACWTSVAPGIPGPPSSSVLPASDLAECPALANPWVASVSPSGPLLPPVAWTALREARTKEIFIFLKGRAGTPLDSGLQR